MTKRELLQAAQDHAGALAKAIAQTDAGMHPMILEDFLIALEQHLGEASLVIVGNLIMQRAATGTWS